MSEENVKEKIAEVLERQMAFHADKLEAVKSVNPEAWLKEIGAVNALDVLWLELVQDGLILPKAQRESAFQKFNKKVAQELRERLVDELERRQENGND